MKASAREILNLPTLIRSLTVAALLLQTKGPGGKKEGFMLYSTLNRTFSGQE